MNDKQDPNGSNLVKADPPVELETKPPPPPTPPQTKTPVQFNQQVNVYQQIPQSAWTGLNSDQIVDLSKVILHQMETFDKRQFDYAMEQSDKQDSRKRRTVTYGSIVAVIGFIITAYLATNGHELVAMTISMPLATILAIIVGNRLIGT